MSGSAPDQFALERGLHPDWREDPARNAPGHPEGSVLST
jgi:hypothetical protein